MNTCKNCGKEFEGKFCPECGTAAHTKPVCPNCGSELNEGAKFCSNCGCDLAAPQAQPAPRSAAVRFDWRRVLRYLPAALFALWAALLWAFYAAPVTKGDGFLIDTVNLYGVLEDDMMSDLFSSTYALIAVAAISCVYAAILAVVYIKGGKRVRNRCTYISFAFHIAIVICAAVFGSALNSYMEGFDDEKGSIVAVVIALTVVFAALQILSIILVRKFPAAECEPKSRQPRAKSHVPSKAKLWLSAHRALVVVLLVVLVLGATVGTVLPVVLGNIFRAGKVDNIQLGDSYARVEKILGEPTTSTETRYLYYSKNVANILKEIEQIEEQAETVTNFSQLSKLQSQLDKLEEELKTLEYKYIQVTFADGKVTSVLLDTKANDEIEDKTKKTESISLSEIPRYAKPENEDIYVSIYYNDGSYQRYKLTNITDSTDQQVFWSDEFGTYTADINYGSEIDVGSVLKVTLDPNGGWLADGESKQQEVVFGYEFSLPVPVKKGYTFLGWYSGDDQITDKNGNSISNDSLFESHKTLTAKYSSAIVYTITYHNVDGANNPNPTSYTVNDYNDFIDLEPATKSGYTFVGWYSDSSLQSKKDIISTSPLRDIELWAKWEYVQYHLTFNYDSNVGDFDGDKPTKYTIEGLTLPRLVGKNGNGHFGIAWRDQTGKIYTNEIPQGTTGDLSLTAMWSGQHNYDSNGRCTICNKLSFVSDDYKTVTFGTYPQSKVEDTALQSMLNAEIQNKLPSSDNANGWTDYGYYIEGEVQSYMWYVDVNYQKDKYRGVYFTSYRPYKTSYSSNAENTYQFDNGYNTNTVYWFKWETITWRIFNNDGGKALIMSDLIIDSQQYYHEDSGTRTIGGKTVYPNNYKESDIRKWLNTDFYNAAFDELSKKFIIQTEVDNSASTTGSSNNQYACENTLDNVFLLSYKEATNSSYGLNSSTRQLKTTDYAQCQGAYTATGSYKGCGWWWLRSPDSTYSYRAYSVGDGGDVGYVYYVSHTDRGVVPALNITI